MDSGGLVGHGAGATVGEAVWEVDPADVLGEALRGLGPSGILGVLLALAVLVGVVYAAVRLGTRGRR